MGKRLLLALAACLVGGGAWAAQMVTPGPMKPLGYCQLTLSGTAALVSTCTGGIPIGAMYAIILDETANSRWRDDGTAPTTTVGMLLTDTAGLNQINYSGDLTKLQFIAVTGSPVLDISFYGIAR